MRVIVGSVLLVYPIIPFPCITAAEERYFFEFDKI